MSYNKTKEQFNNILLLFSRSKLLIMIIALLFIINNFLCFSQDENIEGNIINKIIFKGLKKAKKKDILGTILSKEGTELDLSLVDQDYQNLFSLGYFEDISISTDIAYDDDTNEPISGMLNLIFDFVEKQTIRKTIFRGNKNVSFGILMDRVNIRRGDFLDLSMINSDISAVIEKYHEKGYNYVKVDYEIFESEELREKGRVDIIFVIEEGIETYVSEIIFQGNDNISDFTLRNKIKTKERKFFGLQKGTFIESDFYQDIEDIKKHYRDNGYYLIEIIEPEVTRYEIEEKERIKEIIRIKIGIIEGNQYYFNGLVIKGNKIFDEDDLTFSMKLKKGQLFNYSKYQEVLFGLQKFYTDSGYIQTMINDTPIIDEINKTITVEIDIIESKRSYIESVFFKGNEKTRDYILERSVYTEVGEIFSSNKLMDSVIALHNLGFFLNVEYDIQQGSAPGLLKITYILEEQQTAEVKFGLMIPTNKIPPEITLFAEISEKNFLGRELLLSGKLDVSLQNQGFDFSIDDPWFLNFPWNLGASVKLYHRWSQTVLRKLNDSDYDDYRNDNNLGPNEEVEDSEVRDWYNQRSNGDDAKNLNYLNATPEGNYFNMGIHNLNFEVSTRTGYRFLRYFSVSGGLSVEPIFTWLPEENRPSDFSFSGDIYSPSYLYALENNWSVKAKIHSTFSFNTTRRRINPYEGMKFSFTTGYTFGHYDSLSLSSKLTFYWKILDVNFNDWAFKNVIVFNVGASMILPGFRNIGGELNGRSTAGGGPILYPTDYLTVDGMFSGRGWSNTIGPVNYEDRFVNKRGFLKLDFSLEYRLPIYDRIIWLAGFVDFVNLVEGPYAVAYDDDNNRLRDVTNSWAWWASQNDSNFNQPYQPLGIDNWYGSVGVGFELTIPQLPLSFFVVKRFKINYYSGIEWIQNQPTSGNLDFVLSIVGYYF